MQLGEVLTWSWRRSRPAPSRARRCREVHHLQSALRQPTTPRASQPTPVPSASRRPSGPQRAAAPPSPRSASPGNAHRRPPTRIPPLQLVLNGSCSAGRLCSRGTALNHGSSS